MKLYLNGTRPAPPGWTAVRSLEAAQEHLARGGVEALSLDYDLGPCEDCARNDPDALRVRRCQHSQTGYDLLCWMVDNNRWPDTKPLIHAGNPSGAGKIRSVLEREWPMRGVRAVRRTPLFQS